MDCLISTMLLELVSVFPDFWIDLGNTSSL